MTLRQQIDTISSDLKTIQTIVPKRAVIFNNIKFKNLEISDDIEINNIELGKQLYVTKMGLVNIEDSFFMNAVLEILFHCKIFI